MGSYLEALNLRYISNDLQKKVSKADINSATAADTIRLRATGARITALNKLIEGFEEMYEVKYRPGRPDLFSPEAEFR